MESYTKHRRTAAQIVELARELAAESEAFHRVAAHRGRPEGAAPTLEPSTEWLHQAFCAMLFGIAALRDAREELLDEGEH